MEKTCLFLLSGFLLKLFLFESSIVSQASVKMHHLNDSFKSTISQLFFFLFYCSLARTEQSDFLVLGKVYREY